jgi:hypothetical protein
MASNLSNQSRNVLSKKVMVKKEVIYILQIQIFLITLLLFLDCYKIILCNSCMQLVCHTVFCCCSFSFFFFFVELAHNRYFILSQESLDNITLFSIITIMSFFFLVPVAIFMDGVKFTPAFLQSAVSIFF